MSEDVAADQRPPALQPAAIVFNDDWQALPPQARRLFNVSALLGFGVPAAVGCIAILAMAEGRWLAWTLALGLLVLAALLALWLARKQYRYTFWKLDADGFAVRRGRLWQSETRVPRSRVQHLDLKRGPLERRYGLATLVIHTAGTRQSAVSLTGLDHGDAERLRDHLANQIEHDDDDSVA